MASRYPMPCDLCGFQIESQDDLDWHGYGNCIEIPDEMWEQWAGEEDEYRDTKGDGAPQSAK